MFGVPTLLFVYDRTSDPDATSTFCPQSLTSLNRSLSSAPDATSTFCPQSLTSLNRSLSSAPDASSTFCPMSLTPLSRPTLSISTISGDDYIDATEKTSAVTISGTSSDVADTTSVTVTVNGVDYVTTVTSNAWSVSAPASDVAVWQGILTVTAKLTSEGGIADQRVIGASITANHWYDIADATTLTLTGSDVDAVADKGFVGGSGLSNYGAAKPTYNATLLNSKGGIISGAPGVDDRMRDSSISLQDGGTICVVYKSNTNTTGNTGSYKYLFDGISERWILALSRAGSSAGLALLTSVAMETIPPLTVDLNNHFGIFRFSGSSANSEAIVDGTAETLTTTSSVVRNLNGLNLFGWQSSASTHKFTGHMHEMIFYEGALPASSKDTVNGYLAHKWGLQTNLPTAAPHRYASTTWTPEDEFIEDFYNLDLRFDESNGSTTTVDSSDQNNTVTLVNATVSNTQTAGGSPGSLLLNGSNRYARVPVTHIAHTANESISIHVDFYRETGGGTNQTIIGIWDQTNTSYGWKLFIATNDLVFSNGGTTHNFGATTTGVWYKVHVVYNVYTDEYKLYKDGVLDGTVSGGIVVPNAAITDFYVGAAYNSATPSTPVNYFDGYIDNVQIYIGNAL